MTAWTSAQKRQKQAEYSRLYRAGLTVTQRNPRIVVPSDITVLTRDPSPCFMCGEAKGACRHRPWEMV